MTRSDISPDLLPGGTLKLNAVEARVRGSLADVHRLADEAKSRDAGVLHQRKGPTMSEPSSGGRRAGDLRHQRSQRHRSSNGVVRVSVITLVARTMHAS